MIIIGKTSLSPSCPFSSSQKSFKTEFMIKTQLRHRAQHGDETGGNYLAAGKTQSRLHKSFFFYICNMMDT